MQSQLLAQAWHDSGTQHIIILTYTVGFQEQQD